MSDFTRREGSDDTRDVVGQAATGLPYMTQERPAVGGGTLTTDKADDGLGSSWCRITVSEPDAVGADLFACTVGDTSVEQTELAQYMVGQSEELTNPIRKTRLTATAYTQYPTYWPSGNGFSTMPGGEVLGPGKLAIAVWRDLGTESDGYVGGPTPSYNPDVEPKPGDTGVFQPKDKATVKLIDVETGAVRDVFTFSMPRYRTFHAPYPECFPFARMFHAYGRDGQETWGMAYVEAAYKDPSPNGPDSIGRPRYRLQTTDVPKMALFVGNKSPVIRGLPATGGVPVDEYVQDPDGFTVSIANAYYAPLVVFTSKTNATALVVRGGKPDGVNAPMAPRMYWTEDAGNTWAERTAPAWDLTLYNQRPYYAGADDWFGVNDNPNAYDPMTILRNSFALPWTPTSAVYCSWFLGLSNLSVGGDWRVYLQGKDGLVSLPPINAAGYQIRVTGGCRPKGAAVFSYCARGTLSNRGLSTSAYSAWELGSLDTGEDDYARMYSWPAGEPAPDNLYTFIDDSGGYFDACGIIVVLADETVVRRPFPWPRLNSGARPKVFCTDNTGEEIGTVAYDFTAEGWFLHTSRDLGKTWRRRSRVTSRCPAPLVYQGPIPGYQSPPEKCRVLDVTFTNDGLQYGDTPYYLPSGIVPLRIDEATAHAYPGAPWLYK